MSTKRKRGRSLKPSHLPSDVINPHSHAPDTLKQFVPAGLSADLPLPAELHPLFPHRPLPSPGRRRRGSRSKSATSASARASDASEAETTTTDLDEVDETADEFTTDRASESGVGGNTSASDTEAEAEAGGGTAREREREFGSRSRTARLHQQRVGAVAAICQRRLAEGDIAGAKRAFGLLHRGVVAGKRVDLRHARFWELGTEVLVREGEEKDSPERKGEWEDSREGKGGEERDKEALRRSRARLKGYFEHLVQQYPFSKSSPGVVSALDFYPALFACQMEGIYAEHVSAMEALQEGFDERGHEHDSDGRDHDHHHGHDMYTDRHMGGHMHDEYMDGEHTHDHRLLRDDGMAMDIDMPHRSLSLGYGDDNYEHTSEGHLLKLQREKDRLRREALGRMRELAENMDGAMEAPPFSKDHELLRLRGMVALYIADLCVPLTVQTEEEELEGERARGAARQKARRVFRQVKQDGGKVEGPWIDDLLNEEDDEDEEGEEDGKGDEGGLEMFSSLPMYSSIPMP